MDTCSVGGLVGQPKYYPPSGQKPAFLTFVVASKRPYAEPGTPLLNFWRCLVRGHKATAWHEELPAGRQVIVTGNMDQETYVETGGTRVTMTKILVTEIDIGQQAAPVELPEVRVFSSPSDQQTRWIEKRREQRLREQAKRDSKAWTLR